MSSADLLALIQNRRSVRSFENRAVPPEVLSQIVACGLAAPSSKNSNPWFIVTVTGTSKDAIATWFAEAAALATSDRADRVPLDPCTGHARTDLTDTVAASAATVAESAALLLLFNRAPFSRGVATLLQVIASASERPSLAGRALYGYAGEIVGIAAAAQNMMLAAAALGVGTVYMADSYPVRQRIADELLTTRELVGIIAVGYAAGRTPARAVTMEYAATWEDARGRIDSMGSESGSHLLSTPA